MTPDVYHYLCSLNRCYFFFVLRFLSLQTSGFPLKAGGSPATFWLPRRDGSSSNTGVGYIVLLLSHRLLSILLSVNTCRARQFSVNFVFLDAFAGNFPFETFLTLNYCLVHFSPTLSLHHETRSSCFRFQFLEFLPRTEDLVNQEFLPRAEELMNRAPKHRRGESEWIRLRS